VQHLMGRISGEAPRRPPFSDWLAQVDRILVRRLGLDSGSLEDYPWMGDYRCGIAPGEAVAEYIEELEL
jgi:hypothetical protein